jgi:hypothetical protein
MPCTDPVAQCLAWHIKPKLAHATITNDGLTIRARCPACDHGKDSLTISAGEHARITWHCFACSGDGEIHRALIAAGVAQSCLPRPKRDDAALIDAATAVLLEGATSRHGWVVLRAHLILHGHSRWPKGKELERLAAEVGLGRTEAFAARRAGPLHPVPPVRRPSRRGLSSGPGQGDFGGPEKSARANLSARANSRRSALADSRDGARKVRSSGQVPAYGAASPTQREEPAS